MQFKWIFGQRVYKNIYLNDDKWFETCQNISSTSWSAEMKVRGGKFVQAMNI